MRKSSTKKVDSASSNIYRDIAKALLKAASDLDSLGDRTYGPAIGILSIHASIAYADAVCIRRGGRKSIDMNHIRSADLLNEIVGEKQNQKLILTLKKILSIKSEVEYGGQYYQIESAKKTLKQAQRFAEWAEEMLLMI